MDVSTPKAAAIASTGECWISGEEQGWLVQLSVIKGERLGWCGVTVGDTGSGGGVGSRRGGRVGVKQL